MVFIGIKQALEELRAGKMIVVIDAKDRENEGDVIFAAEHSSEEKVNFIISKAKGVVCVSINEELAQKYELSLMVAKNSSNHNTAFTVTVDAKDAKTGVSTKERNRTIRLLADEASKASDFVRPGHINPLIAKKGGVLERTGHTEASVDLCLLAGLRPACVICEVVKDDGEMARESDLISFCEQNKLSMISIEELIKYRLKNESLIELKSKENSQIIGLECKKLSFYDHNQNLHFAFIFKECKKKTRVKFHLSGPDFELLSSSKYEKLIKDIKLLHEEGGVLIIMQNQEKNDNLHKNYGVGAQILRYLGIEELLLLSKSCDKDFIALEGFGLDLTCI